MQEENVAKLNLGNVNHIKRKRIDIKRKIFIEKFIDNILKPIGAFLFPIIATMLVALYLQYVGEPIRRIDTVILAILLYLSIK